MPLASRRRWCILLWNDYSLLNYMIPILQKAIRVVEAVAAGSADGSMSGLARELKIAPASCYRIVQTLEGAGWIAPREGGGFEIAAGLLGLVHPLSNVQRLVHLVAEPLTELAQESELAVKMTVRDGRDAVTVFRAESPRGIALVGRTGARFPLPVGSSGAVLCADLSEEEMERLIAEADKSAWKLQTPAQFRKRVLRSRSEGLCVDRGSFHPQIHTLSGPLVGSAGEVIAAVTLIGLPADVTDRALPGLRKQLTEALRGCQARVAGGPLDRGDRLSRRTGGLE
jgi:DNA-binding IclR family transcriptional regulator